ncbi:flap endonuclease GEN-like 2 [Phalaenopsis equestris]|uniref:flap endonuclease GEN-like 2 n=1 Tax=Phalaenopsis equestris TaxID=78828 RepID=UPI0009E5F578|nr:flap endonuclease GEN-like 2 [Phalaenopsis equestris]
MGVKNLWDILESCKKTLPLNHLQNKRLCVDLSCWLIQFQNASRSACAKEKPYLKTLFHRLRALIALNCSLIFVADGAIPSIKLSTYRRRLGLVSEISNDDRTSEAMTSLRRNMGSEFSRMIKEAKVLGLALGIPFLDGIEEAEAQCALFNSESLCDGCFTSDSDIFLFGARTVYREIFLGEGGYVICYDMVDIEKKLGFGRNSLIALALLLGSDYSHGVYGFGPETSCQLVKSIGDINILLRVKSEGLAFAEKKSKAKATVKSLNCNFDKENLICYKQPNAEREKKLEPNDNVLEIINAYLKPKCHLPDSEVVQSACTTHPFQRGRLQQICAISFGWTPEKTDEYILPKIAERDLRRFANLRNTPSEPGANIPWHKMPVPCPVTAIVKQRKLQGRECFEVSWQDMYGLQTSIVSADLIESACPEKIAEFREKKTMVKKRITRKQKPKMDSNVDLNKVDFQLQGLLLDTEPQSYTHHQPSSSSQFLHDIGAEIIDLSSPSPPLRACKLARSHEAIDRQMKMIDLCETDGEVSSPEHERKARELRLFIESIRGDL